MKRREILARQIAADINWLERRREISREMRRLVTDNENIAQENRDVWSSNAEIIRQAKDLEARFAVVVKRLETERARNETLRHMLRAAGQDVPQPTLENGR